MLQKKVTTIHISWLPNASTVTFTVIAHNIASFRGATYG